MNNYHEDFYAWAMENAKNIREGNLSEIDRENIAEELESMGRSEKRELINRLAVLIAHLLKWLVQPSRRSNSWRYTIEEQRKKVIEVLEENPSLRHEIESRIDKAYSSSILIAAKETGMDKICFPQHCPFSLQEIMDDNFLPEKSLTNSNS